MHNINKKNMIYIVAFLSSKFLFKSFFFCLFVLSDYFCCNVNQDVTKSYLFPFALIEDSQVKYCLKSNTVGNLSIYCYFIIVGWWRYENKRRGGNFNIWICLLACFGSFCCIRLYWTLSPRSLLEMGIAKDEVRIPERKKETNKSIK